MVGGNGAGALTIGALREEVAAEAGAHPDAGIRAALILCAHVLCDLRAQGWLLQVSRGGIAACPAPRAEGAVADEKSRLRAAHLVERDAQLRQAPVRRFIREMERRRLYHGKWCSVFSLMRDGRALAAALQAAAACTAGPERQRRLRTAVAPYVQVVEPGRTCEFTGLRLTDIWRYFRHTWTTTYQSTPGRKLFFLVRDRAADNHPVVGIGALGSAIVQLSVRDAWIGWTGPAFLAQLRQAPDARWAKWLARSLTSLIASIAIDDFLTEGVLRARDLEVPSEQVVATLRELAATERRLHRLYPKRGQHKRVDEARQKVDWAQQAGTHLFRSKRAAALADLLEARRRLTDAGFTRASAAALRTAIAQPAAARAVQTVLRAMKAAHVGVHMMDVTVCGAVAPYNALLGGKLVSLLMASPAVVAAYNQRYRKASSVIASSMAGRAVQRTPRLVLLGTTSLYAVGASQYNRLRMPAARAGGVPGAELAYQLLGRTAGYGSYHFSRETMRAIAPVLRRLHRGRPVNSIFGEGVHPKLRNVRSALDLIGLPSDLLLQHGSPRLVYAIPLATNFRDVLLGVSREPDYLLPQTAEASDRVVDFWRERWLSPRVEQPETLARVARESLAHPIRHHARVQLPEVPGEAGPLFESAAPGGATSTD